VDIERVGRISRAAGKASMLRFGAIFILICMVLIAASVGAVLYLLVGLNASEAMTAAIAVLTGLAIYNAVVSRLRDRSDVGGQITLLTRGIGDLARQVAALGHRVAALENPSDDGSFEKTEAVAAEIAELGTLVTQLA
jgi:cyclic-di-GMP phosphodiesterase, flagellum assembly factor TipF